MGSALPYLSRFHALLLLFRRFLLIRILLIRFLAMTGISTILQVVKLKESVKKATITMPAMKSISTILQVESVRRAVLSSIFPTDWEQELKILAGISKLPNDKYCKYCKYWIGIEKKTADAFWVSGEKMELDGSELKFASDSQWGNKTLQNMCGAIDLFGINDVHCDDGLVGYVCEFANE